MSTPTTATRLVPRPLSDDYPTDPDPTHDTIGMWGYCAEYCMSSDDQRTNGLTVAEHGEWCRSSMTAYIKAADNHASRVTVSTVAAEPYRHGTYALGGVNLDQVVQIELVGPGIEPDDDDEARTLTVSIGDAYRLAAGLVRAAEIADSMDRDFRGATRRRERIE